jgi:hypothetical protein
MYRRNAVHAAFSLAFILGFADPGHCQGRNNLWMFGYASWAGLPYGGTNLEFNSDTVGINYVNREMSFNRTAANISNIPGSLLFATNGYYIADANGDTLLNGTGLNPSTYTAQFPEGLNLSQSDLILPKPDSPNIYYLFHGTYDHPPYGTAQYLYLSVIDMTLNGGLGAVVSKNQVLIDDLLNMGKITAVRHANGRDWWVFCHKVDTNTFYRLLVTPEGVGFPETQDIGTVRPNDLGQVCFSPDGSKFAYYWGDGSDLDIFDFDRCTGLFFNPVHIAIDDYNQMGGVAFSPSSQFLYVSSVLDVYQYDVTVADVESSMVHIALWDSTYSPSPPFATLFDIAQLAQDGKIYIATGNSTFKLHVIDHPDLPGFACGMVQHGITLPTYNSNSLPNHPNYFLGPVDGSVCDSLGINTLTPTLSQGEGAVRAFPNPSGDGRFVLRYPANYAVGWLEVRNLAGQVVLRERIPQWSTVHAVELEGHAAGMYQCSLRWGLETINTRVIIRER